eukprot:scaffold287630_cov13-Tisochrysis_lutea.AAC.1
MTAAEPYFVREVGQLHSRKRRMSYIFPATQLKYVGYKQSIHACMESANSGCEHVVGAGAGQLRCVGQGSLNACCVGLLVIHQRGDA